MKPKDTSPLLHTTRCCKCKHRTAAIVTVCEDGIPRGFCIPHLNEYHVNRMFSKGSNTSKGNS